MKIQPLTNTDLTVSQLCYGTMQLAKDELTQEDCDRLMDAYMEAGGNFFDTAHCYCFWLPKRDGASERVLGDYVQRRGCRNSVVLATKGAHPSMPDYRTAEQFMSVGRIGADIDDSLSRMKIDTIDLYWLHRDDPCVPVSEILECLNAEVARGRIRYFGGSNWTSQRLAEANAYAQENGLMGFVGSQSRWNLACDDEDPQGQKRLEPGELLAVSQNDAQWHEQSQLPIVPYSPTANGFFATGGEAGKQLYGTSRGKARLAVAQEVAQELGATPNQIAIAWLLHQPFPVFPILGTVSMEHLQDAVAATGISLSDKQMARLNV